MESVNNQQKIQPLSEVKKNRKGVVHELQTNEEFKMQKILAMGIMPGKPIHVIQSWPVIVLQIETAQMALDKNLADAILVDTCAGSVG